MTSHALVDNAPAISGPDDIGTMNGEVYVGYQNGVGSTGGASPSGGTTSTIVEYRMDGTIVQTWSVTGKCDGLTADPATNRVLLTVNEDGNSSMYVIHPSAAPANQVVHLNYSPDLATVTGAGGTDAIIVQNGNVYTTGSAPTTTDAPAIYQIGIDETTGTATMTGLFNDNATANGPDGPVNLALTDPDSANVVPASSPDFGGDIMFSSQADSQLLFIHNPGAPSQTINQLPIGTQVNDVEWATASTGTLYITDNQANKVYAIDSTFPVGTVFVAAPSDSGDAGFFGSQGGKPLKAPVVGMAPTPSGQGYWLVAADGGVFSFGDAGFYGSLGGQTQNHRIVAMEPTASGHGYWLVASNGTVTPFGDASNFGSLTSAPGTTIVGMASTPSASGYWLVASDGNVFAFGDARVHGSAAGQHLNAPIVSMTPTASGQGYWLFAADGGVFSYGDAQFYDSMGGQPLNAPIVGSST
jgi:hypothetical protein